MSLNDFILEKGNHGTMVHVTDETKAIILSIRNILLTKSGQFALSPDIGMNIEKYLFELADAQTTANIKNELGRHISKFIPNLTRVQIMVEFVLDTQIINGKEQTVNCIAIHIEGTLAESSLSTDFIVYSESDDEVTILNKIN